MRGRYGSADAVEAAKNQVPLILCKPNRPMDRGRNGARYFRNPPQPHMCIQDIIEDTNEPCFINVLSWAKISTPRRPEDPIPLYGGMQVPHNSSAALSLSSHFGPKAQPAIFAVMANPEILRLNGKTAEDPSDRDALIELMLDFVEAMNPDIRFRRDFTVLRDRDLAGELKDIWLAVQAKRERERAENGRREAEKLRDIRDEQWREEVRQKTLRNVDYETEQSMLSSPVHGYDRDSIETTPEGNIMSQEDCNHQKQETEMDEGFHFSTGEVSSLTPATTAHLSTIPSMEPSNDTNIQNMGAMKYGKKSVSSLIRSHYESEFNRTDTVTAPLNSDETSDQKFSDVYSSGCLSSAYKQTNDNIVFPLLSESDDKDLISTLGAASSIQIQEEMNKSLAANRHVQNYCTSHEHQGNNTEGMRSGPEEYTVNSSKSPASPSKHPTYDSKIQLKEKGGAHAHQGKSTKNSSSIPAEHLSNSGDGHIFSGYATDTVFLSGKAQVPNMAGRSHEDLLPALGDSSGVKFPVGNDHNTVAIP